jgi:hypothetical protein
LRRKKQSPCQELVLDEKMLYVAINLGLNSTVQCVNLAIPRMKIVRYLRRSMSGQEGKIT